MKRVILVVETFGWAFHNIAKQIAKHFGDRYKIDIIAREDSIGATRCDVVLCFWWKSALRARDKIIAKRTCIGLYDHWSIAQEPMRFQIAALTADCFFAGNETIRDDLKLRAPGKQIELTEDGVDLDLFTPQPFPETFTVGWTGNRIYEMLGLGDLKGVRLIEEACRLADVPLVIQDKQVQQIPQERMPEDFYRKISCYVCASKTEGTPNPILEALACGRRVVTTDVGVVPKVINPCNGLIVSRTVEAIADGVSTIKRCMNAPESNGEPRRAMESWDWKEKAKAFGPVLEGG